MKLETLKSLRWADYFIYTLSDPREFVRRARQKDPDPFFISFLIPCIVVLFDILAFSAAGRETGFFYYKISYGWIMLFIIALFKIGIYSSLVDLTAQFFGLKGNVREIIVVLNFSMFPGIFFLPLYYLSSVTGFAPGFFYVFFSIVFFIWSLLIFIQGVSEIHSIDFGKSFVMVVLPGIAAVLLIFLVFILFFIMLAGYAA